MKNVSVSVLSCNFLKLSYEIERINHSDKVQSIHLDIMDGIFVPNISFGFDISKQIALASKKPCSAHLMISDPLKYLSKIADIGIENIFVHIKDDIEYMNKILDFAKNTSIKIGITLSPKDQPDTNIFKNIIEKISNILIMTVEPGFGGQKFDPSQLKKADFIKRISPNKKITIDGGVKFSMLDSIDNVDEFVIGSDFFNN